MKWIVTGVALDLDQNRKSRFANVAVLLAAVVVVVLAVVGAYGCCSVRRTMFFAKDLGRSGWYLAGAFDALHAASNAIDD